jgi:phosphatidylglycerophosphate synthase
MRRARLHVFADILTVSRLGLALSLIPAVWTSSLTLASALISLAWLTDLLDGRLARAARAEGRLGPWDLGIDTCVGVGVLIGLMGAGDVPVVLGVTAIFVLGSWSFTGNFAAALLLQLVGYLPLLAIVWARRPLMWWLPFLTVIMIGLLDRQRLMTVNIPLFIRALTGRLLDHATRHHSPDDTPA